MGLHHKEIRAERCWQRFGKVLKYCCSSPQHNNGITYSTHNQEAVTAINGQVYNPTSTLTRKKNTNISKKPIIDKQTKK